MLQSLKKCALSIKDYVLKMRNIADMLSASGKPIPDEDLILYILGGLGLEFETIVVNITSRSEAISLQEVHYLLQSHEICLEQLSTAFVIDVHQQHILQLEVFKILTLMMDSLEAQATEIFVLEMYVIHKLQELFVNCVEKWDTLL